MAEISDEVLDLLENHPWEDTIARLVSYALGKMRRRYWLGVLNGSAPSGVEAKDIVMGSIAKVFEGERNWDPEAQPDLFAYLKGVVDSTINHLAEGWENSHFNSNKSISEGADNEIEFLNTVPDFAPTVEEELIAKELEAESEKFFWDFYENLDDQPKLLKILDGLSEGYIKRADLARYADLSVREFDNLKKQLRRRLKSFQEARSGGANELYIA